MSKEEIKALKNNLLLNVGTIVILLLILTGTFYNTPLERKKLLLITNLFSSKNTNFNDVMDFSAQLVPLLLVVFVIALYNFMSSTYITKENFVIFFPKKIQKSIAKIKENWSIIIFMVIILFVSIIYIFYFSPNYEIVIQYVTNSLFACLIIFEIAIKPIQNKLSSQNKFNLMKYKYNKRKVDVFNSVILILLVVLISLIYKEVLSLLLLGVISLFIFNLFEYMIVQKNPIDISKTQAYLSQMTILLLSIFLLFRKIPYEYFGFYFFILFILFKLILFIVSLIGSFLLNEHKIAQIEKQGCLNREVIHTLLNQFKDDKIGTLQKSNLRSFLIHQLNKKKYKINHTLEFELFIADLNSDLGIDKQKLLKAYKHMLLNYSEISIKLGNLVKKRNLKNLLIPCLLMIIILFMEALNECYNLASYSEVKTFRMVLFAIIMYRLITRFIEIGIAFYFDIKPNHSLKKTNLTNNDRVVLVLKSLIEITILSSILYFEYALLNNEIKNFKILLITLAESMKYAIAVALFNLSYPVDFAKDMAKIGQFEMLKKHNTFYIVHLIQLLMSVLLVSLSIGSYSSRNFSGSSFEIQKIDNEYTIFEKIKDNDFDKVIIEDKDYETLIKLLNDKWQDGSLSTSNYIEIKELINFSIIKQ